MPRISLAFLLTVLLLAAPAAAAEIKGPSVKIKDNHVVVAAMLELDAEQMAEIEKGVSKEFVFYFDLFRNWDAWPDEFITGLTFTRTLSCDPVKKEYIATSLSGRRLKEKRFRSCRSMMSWALHFPEFRLVNLDDLEPAEYRVKVTAESRLRRLPPFINLLFFFVKEKEFTVTDQSPYFQVGPARSVELPQ